MPSNANSNDSIAVIAVITSAIVAIASALLPLFFEYSRRKEERKSKEITNIEAAASELLNSIALYASGRVEEAGRMSRYEAYSILLSNFYKWEVAVWPRAENTESQTISDIRKVLQETSDKSQLASEHSEIADRILRVTKSASKRVK